VASRRNGDARNRSMIRDMVAAGDQIGVKPRVPRDPAKQQLGRCEEAPIADIRSSELGHLVGRALVRALTGILGGQKCLVVSLLGLESNGGPTELSSMLKTRSLRH
jgi:hypothetical protein